MTGDAGRGWELLALAELLDAYGHDGARWPASARERFAPLLAAEPAARELLAEAAALDRLLDAAPVISQAGERRLIEQIVAAADAGNVVRLRRPASPVDRRTRLGVRPAANWPAAAALLAASLLVGVLIGTAANFGPEMQVLADAVGLSADLEPVAIALNDAAVGLVEEEPL